MKITLALIVTLAVLLTFVAGRAATITYSYDAAGRLTGADYGGGDAIAYTYDAAGNLLDRTTTAAPSLEDVIVILQTAAGLPSTTTITAAADLNGDHVVGLAEAVALLRDLGR